MSEWVGYLGSYVVTGRGDRRRPRESEAAGGKSELHRAGCWLTASRGDSKESATENKPPASQGAPQGDFLRTGKGETVR